MGLNRQYVALGLLCLLATILVFGCGGRTSEPQVYIGQGDSHYHAQDCPELGTNAKKYAKSAAAGAGYEPCPKCQLGGAPARDATVAAPSGAMPEESAAATVRVEKPPQESMESRIARLTRGMPYADVCELLDEDGTLRASAKAPKGQRDSYVWRLDTALQLAATFVDDSLLEWEVTQASASPARAQIQPQPASQAVEDTVYIAPNSGNRYHRSQECRSLRNARSVVSINRDKARADGYTPCKICKPR